MQHKRIGIDLDLTTVRSDLGWLSWLEQRSTFFRRKEYTQALLSGRVEYYLPKYFVLHKGVDPMAYWKEKVTYPNVAFLPECKEVIRNLYEAGYEIIFISYCMGCPDQIGNKLNFLKEEFDFLLPRDFNFVPTKKKHLVNVDYMIDDRNQFLQTMDSNVKLIKIKTPYTQDFELNREHTLVGNWSEVEDYFCEELESRD